MGEDKQILWRYSEIEILFHILENMNINIDGEMDKLREQNRILSESMSGESKRAFESSYLIMHNHMTNLKTGLDNLIKKGREACAKTDEQDEKIAADIGKRG